MADWVQLDPPFASTKESPKRFALLAKQLQNSCESEDDPRELAEQAARQLPKSCSADRGIFRAAGLALADLVHQEWEVKVEGKSVSVSSPAGITGDPLAVKARLRQRELIKRDEQLGQEATRRFIKEMETKRLFNGHFISIYSLMRDGKELAAKLNSLRDVKLEDHENALEGIIEPYLQFVSEGAVCSQTGYRLQDIWRYFRHTWANPYTSVPGRTMGILIRDRSQPTHPVIGIAALSSPVMQIRTRDLWIGWHPEAFIERLKGLDPDRVLAWVNERLESALDEIYVEDFLEEKLLPVKWRKSPSVELIDTLLRESRVERERHYRFTQDAGRDSRGTSTWIDRAGTHLFRGKRALALSKLLGAKLAIDACTTGSPGLEGLLSSGSGREAVNTILRKAKGDRVGICMADITVCGSVAPYNAILGGKLVCMLLCSPEVVLEYKRRYGSAESEIASSVAGRPIVRPPSLVFLGTTSLYGVGSSQYNRVRIPTKIFGVPGTREIRYEDLGKSEAFGTSHYSGTTIEALVELTEKSKEGQRVNSIFGEGVSPKLRKVREGLNLIGFPPEDLLRHGRQRIVYGVTLAENYFEVLTGLDEVPHYFAPTDCVDATKRISNWWAQRWLSSRIKSDDILTRVSSHSLVHPIRHGARVTLPEIEEGLSNDFDDY